MKKINLERHWKAYLALILVPIIVWIAVYNILDEPADNEKFSVLFLGDGLDCEGLQEWIETELDDKRMKSITVEDTVIYESLYYEYLQTRCYSYDVIIIPEKNMKEHVGRLVFEREIMIDDYSDKLPSAPFYYENIDGQDLPFGYVLPDDSTDSVFSRYYNGDEKCYLFISPRSVNFDQINGEGEKGDDFGLKVLFALLEK